VSTGGTGTEAPYDRVFVHDLVLDAEIGVYTHEKGVTQRARFSVDVEVTPPEQAVEDQIGRVLDYDMIIAIIKGILAEGHINLVETLADATVRSRLGDAGSEIPTRERQTPQSLASLQKAEIEKWWPIIKAANIKGE